MPKTGKSAPEMDEPRLYNSRIIQSWLRYLSENHPDTDLSRLLEAARITRSQVEDQLHWFSQSQVDGFHAHIDAVIDEDDISRRAGRFAVYNKRPTVLQQFTFGFLDPLTAYLSLHKITHQITRGSKVTVRKISATRVEIINTQAGGAEEKPFQCENRIGCYEAVARLFTKHYAKVEHPECLHRDGTCCRYRVSWQSVAHRRWGSLRNLLVAVTLILGGGLMLGGQTPWALKAGLPLAVITFVVAAVASQHEKKHMRESVEHQGSAARKLFYEINLRHNSAALIQEISNLTSWNLNIRQILEFVAHAVKTRLGPDRVVIVYHDTEEGRRAEVAHEGYRREDVVYFKTAWRQRDEAGSGPVAAMIKERQPILLQMQDAHMGKLDSVAARFMQRIDAQAFTGVPIVFKDRLMGFMAADYTRGGRYMTDIDVRLFQGVAAQMAINIANIASFHKIRASEARYRLLADNVFDVIWSLELARMRFDYVSASVTRLTGFEVEEFLALAPKDILPPASLKLAYAAIAEELAYEKQPGANLDRSRTIQLENLRKDGSRFWVEIIASLVRDEKGEAIRILGVTRDISERIAAQQEQERLRGQLERARKMEALGTLAGGVAHDLNNILAGVVSYPDLLLMGLPPDSPMVMPLKTILKSGERAAAIVQDLLTLARRGVPVSAPVNLNTIVEEYLASPEFEKMLSFHSQCKVTADLIAEPCIVEGSEVHLAKTVMNLASNAAEAMPDGGTLEIKTWLSHVETAQHGFEPILPGRYVVLQVKDTGTGIDAQDLSRIFEPFYTKKVMGRSGTGLGMAVVWGTVKDHHGFIDVKTGKGEGTRFSLYFPRGDLSLEDMPATETADSYQGGGEIILVVDDLHAQREVATAILTQLGYRVHAADSGEAAVEYLQDHTVDLVLLDMIMDPGMDGLDTYRHIIQKHPGQKAIIASGYSETKRVLEAQRLGVSLCIKKPFNVQTIGSAVWKVINRK